MDGRRTKQDSRYLIYDARWFLTAESPIIVKMRSWVFVSLFHSGNAVLNYGI